MQVLYVCVCRAPSDDSELCVLCLLVLVVDAMGDQIVLAYSIRGRVIALYVTVRVSFCFPKDDEVSAFRMLKDLSVLSLASLMCSL